MAFYAVGAPLGANVSFLLGIIVPYWSVKCIFSVLETPLVYLGVWWLAREAPRKEVEALEDAAA